MPIAASLIVKVAADVGDVSKGLSQADRAVSQFGTNAGRSGEAAARGFATLGTAAGVAGGVVAAGLGVAVRGFADFDSTMSGVKAVSGATGAQMAQLSATAVALGNDASLAGIGAKDAATAMEELAKGGLSVDQVMTGTRGALLLASAGGIAVGQASEIAANAMNSFGISGDRVAEVADTMALAANKSSADVGELGQSLQQGGSIAAQFGLSLKDTVTAFALFANEGIKGSDAGTSFKQMLLSLAAPSDKARATMDQLGLSFFDAQGKMKDVAGISGELHDKLAGLTDQQREAALATIFGSDAIRVANVLFKDGAEGAQRMGAALSEQGAAARIGAERNQNLKGSIEQLKSAGETLAITFGGKLAPDLDFAAKKATDLAGWFGHLDDSTQKVIVRVGEGVVGFAALALATSKVVAVSQTLSGAFSAVIGVMGRKLVAKEALTGANAALAASMGATGVAATGLATKLGIALVALQGLATLAAAGIGIKIAVDLVTTGKSQTGFDVGQFVMEHFSLPLAKALQAGFDILPSQVFGPAQAQFRKWVDDLTVLVAAGNHSLAGGLTTGASAAAAAMGAVGTAATGANAALAGTPGAADQAAAAMQRAAIGSGMAKGAFVAEAASVYDLTGALAGLSGQHGALSGQLGILQPRIDALQAKQKEGIALSAAEESELTTLLVARDRLSDQSGILAAEERARVLAMAGLNDQFGPAISGTDALTDSTGRLGRAALDGAVAGGNLGLGINEAANAAKAGALKVEAYAGRIRDIPPAAETAITADTAAGLQNIDTFDGALNALPKTVTTTAQAEVGAALMGIGAVSGAIAAVPRSFTINAYVRTDDAIAAINNLNQYIPRSPAEKGPFRQLPTWDAIFAALPEAAERYGGEAAKKLADGLAAISGAVKSGVDALGSIGGAFGAGAGGTSAFLGALGDLLEKFTTLAGGWEEDVLKQAGTFADTASKATGLVKTGVEAFKALADFAPPAESAVSAFGKSLTDTMEKFTTWAGGFEEDSLKGAETFAEGAGKSLGIIKGAVEGLGALRLFVAPAQSTVSEFGAALTDLMEKFQTWAGGFEADGLAAASTFAEAAGKVTSAVKGALDLFKGLQDAGGFEHIQGAMQALDDAVYASLPFIERIGFNLAVVAQNLAPKWSDDTGKVIGLVKSISDLFKDLVKDAGDFVHIPQTMKLLDDAFFASLQYMQTMAFNAAAWELAANTWQVNVSMGVAELRKGFAALQGVPSSFPSLPGIPDAPSLPPGHRNTAALAGGGIVTRPTVALLGERGPEAVVPLARASAYAPSGGDVHIHFEGPVLGATRDFEEAVVRAMLTAERRGRVRVTDWAR